MRKIGIIGGTGVYNPDELKNFVKKIVKTPYGVVSCTMGELYGNQVVFLNRHGTGHSVPPHMINYRANIWALKKLGTQEIFATAAVGSCNKNMLAGDFVICDQILDFTKSRINTFYDGKNYPVGHADFTHPYCRTLRNLMEKTLGQTDFRYHSKGTMVVTEGPRFETPAEIKMYAKLGGDVVNMTGMPEAILAKEAEMHYVALAIVTNQAAGFSKFPLSHEEVLEAMQQSEKQLATIIDIYLKWAKTGRKVCACEATMANYGGFKLK